MLSSSVCVCLCATPVKELDNEDRSIICEQIPIILENQKISVDPEIIGLQEFIKKKKLTQAKNIALSETFAERAK